jgi:hypothetical protein
MTMSVTVVKSLALLMAATLLASCDPFGLRDVLRAASRSPLSLDPTDVVVPAGATLTFTADGGIPPYAWSVFSGVGSIDADSGDYLASLSTGAAVVRVTDAAGSTADADVTVEELVEGLTITPSAITVTVNAAVQFGAVGGTGSYAYDFAGTGSGSPDLNPATGYYVAGSVPGTDTVRVSDGSSPPDTATVTVVPLDSAVDYSVTSTAGLPSSAVAGSVIGGGVTFTLANTGPGDGNATVSCRVYLSDDVTLDGGDVVVTEGITGALASGGSTLVGLGGDWPSGPVGPGFLIVTVSAADDTSPGNNTSAAAAFTLDPRPVDYDVISVSHTTGTFTGQSVTGSFTVRNIGTAAGAVTLHWFVYASTDTLLDGGDYLLQSGTHAALAPAVPTPIAIASTWPTTPAAYRLLVTVSAADDVAGGNDIGWSSAITVTGAPPADIDYHAAAPVNTGGTNAGGAMTGTFQVTNDGTIAGSQTLYWTIYRSPDATLEIGSDDPVAMGSRAGLGPTPPNPATTIPYSGTWPASADTWYLFAVVSAGDDVAPGDNESTGTMVSTTAPVVDYMVQVFTETSSPVAGDPIAGTLQLHNEGSAGGSQSITWWVFISQDAVLNPFGDLPVDAARSSPRRRLGDHPLRRQLARLSLPTLDVAALRPGAGGRRGRSVRQYVEPARAEHRISERGLRHRLRVEHRYHRGVPSVGKLHRHQPRAPRRNAGGPVARLPLDQCGVRRWGGHPHRLGRNPQPGPHQAHSHPGDIRRHLAGRSRYLVPGRGARRGRRPDPRQ